MNRRMFTSAVAGMIASAGVAKSESVRRYAIRPLADANSVVILLEAVIAARLPERLALVETDTGDFEGADVITRPLPALFELRTYRAQTDLSTTGIAPWLAGLMQYLIPFESLSQRDQVWREVTAQRTWPAYEFAIYRPIAPLRPDGHEPRQQYTS